MASSVCFRLRKAAPLRRERKAKNILQCTDFKPRGRNVYLPTSTPTNDHYGGHRPGDNLFAESIVCLEASTGRRVWHFQTTHHGLWDYDLPAAPVLADLSIQGRHRKVLAQVSKQAFVYVGPDQFVVVPVGGGGVASELVALALSDGFERR